MTQLGAVEDEQAKVESRATDRLTFFSDAVVAIAITLLALELPVPEGAINTDALHELNEHGGEFVAFFISFGVITMHWLGHHRVFRYVRAVPPAARAWNMAWLLTIVLTPFAAKVLAGPGAFEFRFVTYATVQALAGLFFLLVVRSLDRTGAIDPIAPPRLLANSYERLIAVTAMFLVSIPVAFVTQWAYVCWLAIPLVGSVPRWSRGRRHLKAVT